MSLTLPAVLSAYFDICNGPDAAGIVHCFAQDAVVRDEGRSHRGHDAIRSWQLEARKKFDYTVEPVSATRHGDRLVVTANVVGNFPGSPVRLDHVFDLAQDKITSLEIG